MQQIIRARRYHSPRLIGDNISTTADPVDIEIVRVHVGMNINHLDQLFGAFAPFLGCDRMVRRIQLRDEIA